MKKRRQRTKLVSPEEVAISHCVKNEDPSGFLKVLISREIGEFYFQNFKCVCVWTQPNFDNANQ